MLNRIAPLLVAAALVGQVLFPPFLFRIKGGVVFNLGYGFILRPPLYDNDPDLPGFVNIELLAIQLLVTAAVGALLIWALRRA